MLIVSLISVAMTWGEIIPQKFSAFGIELNDFKERNLLILLAVVVIYFLFEFVIHANSEYKHLRIKDRVYKESIAVHVQNMRESDKNSLSFGIAENLYDAARYVNGRWLMHIFDLYIPVISSLIAVSFLISKSYKIPVTTVGIYIFAISILVIKIHFINKIVKNYKRNSPLRKIKQITRKSKNRSKELARIAQEAQAFPEDSPERQEMVAQFNEKVKSFIREYEQKS